MIYYQGRMHIPVKYVYWTYSLSNFHSEKDEIKRSERLLQ